MKPTTTQITRQGLNKQSLLLAALQDGRTVTHATALIDYKIPNITAVIGDLRRQGHDIVCQRKLDVQGKPYSTWSLMRRRPVKRVA